MTARYTTSIQLNDSVIFAGGIGNNVLLFDLTTGWNIASTEPFLSYGACYVQISENEILKLGGLGYSLKFLALVSKMQFIV